MLRAQQVIDGYQILRPIGRGGFGEVWLCRSTAIGDYRALKFIPQARADMLQKEFQALVQYRKAAARLRSPALLAIEHVNRNEEGLYYVMPLADGVTNADPTEHCWVPMTLGAKIHEQSGKSEWFTIEEIKCFMLPVLDALQTLCDAGLIHRDVKPDNILFFEGQPCLGDISLLGLDGVNITRRGTPGYQAPSWYEGRLPDMYGAAATLYTLLTGNAPDKMGRSAFRWPRQGESSLPTSEHLGWGKLHSVVRRATNEVPAERYRDFRAMAQETAKVIRLCEKPLILAARHRVQLISKAVWEYVLHHKKGLGWAMPILSCIVFKLFTNANSAPLTPVPKEKDSFSERRNITLQRSNPQDKEAKEKLALSQIEEELKANRPLVAMTRIENEVRLLPSAQGSSSLSLLRAMALIQLMDANDAMEELRKSRNTCYYTLEARIPLWECAGMLDEAEVDVTTALKGTRNNSRLLFMRAEIRVKRGNFAGAEDDRKVSRHAAAKLVPSFRSPEMNRIDAWWNLLTQRYTKYAEYIKEHPDSNF